MTLAFKRFLVRLKTSFSYYFLLKTLVMNSRQMRVLFIASYFPKPTNTVMGTWALNQAQALVRQGVELQTISFTSAIPRWMAFTPGAKAYATCPTEYTWPGTVHTQYPRWLYYPIAPIKHWSYARPLPYLNIAWRSAKRALLQTVRDYQPDIIFCHHSLPNGWIATQLPHSERPPIFVLDHDYDEITDCRCYPSRKAAMQQVSLHAEKLLAVSHRMQKDLDQLFPSAHTATLHNGITLPLPDVKKRPRPSEIRGLKVVLACALFSERKGIPLLIRAFHKISAKHPDAILRIIGTGPDIEKIKKTIEELALHQQVQLLGKLSHADVLQEMSWADCFALVGWSEPFATVYLEAMAAGKPIICCEDGGINDVVTNGIHGYTVPPKCVDATADAIDRLLSQDAIRRTMGLSARQLVERHLTWDAKAAELIQHFKHAL